jgi:GTP cyclohydrolase I
MNRDQVINQAIFESEANNMIIARDIEISCLCEHHMLPFYGRCHIDTSHEEEGDRGEQARPHRELYARRLQIRNGSPRRSHTR